MAMTQSVGSSYGVDQRREQSVLSEDPALGYREDGRREDGEQARKPGSDVGVVLRRGHQYRLSLIHI